MRWDNVDTITHNPQCMHDTIMAPEDKISFDDFKYL
jgi:hypothetical protein